MLKAIYVQLCMVHDACAHSVPWFVQIFSVCISFHLASKRKVGAGKLPKSKRVRVDDEFYEDDDSK